MARLTPTERREAILEATLAVMLRKGLAGTTVRDVADEMGSSSGLVHHYFASMDELLAEAFTRCISDDLAATQAAVAEGEGAREQLERFFATYARADDWAFQMWLDAWSEGARRPAVRAATQALNLAWQQLVADIIRAGITEGDWSCSEPDAAAWRILSVLDGLALQAVAHPGLIDRERVIEWSTQAAARELRTS